MYRLVYSSGIPGLSDHPIEDIYPLKSSTNSPSILVRQGEKVLRYRYDQSRRNWVSQWSRAVYSQPSSKSEVRLGLVSNNLLANKNILMLSHPTGIQFYQVNDDKPELLKEDRNFHEVYSFDYLWGKFYPDSNWIGVMTRDADKQIAFYAATPDSLDPDEPDALFPLETELTFSPEWSSPDTQFVSTKLIKNNPDLIGLRTNDGLTFYKFNTDYLLEKVIATNQIRKQAGGGSKDYLYFGNPSGKTFQDILQVKSNGLFTFQYDSSKRDYKLLNSDINFTKDYGWLPRHSESIKLFDVNRDGRDDLLYTGPKGLTVLTLDRGSWKVIVRPDDISPASQRFAYVVGVLPSNPPQINEPSIFTQDSNRNMSWARIEPAPIISSISTTIRPATMAMTSSSRPVTRQGASTYPVQVSRKPFADKQTLFWGEQWDGSFLKDVVDPASGQVRMNIPLVDILSSTGWRIQLDLSYNSRMTKADFLGVGWSMQVGQDYITVDYQESVYAEDAKYYLITSGRPNLLKFVKTENFVKHFKLSEGDEKGNVLIEFHETNEQWLIKSSTEEALYGKGNGSYAKDALQWSLSWPNWRGSGKDKARQERLVTNWYLNTRTDKSTDKILYYFYDKDSLTVSGGKLYDSGLRLSSISDNEEVELNLQYGTKTGEEYALPNPLDDKGNVLFPLPISQSYYLTGYTLTTGRFSQELKFSYVFSDKKRLLTEIVQVLGSQSQSVVTIDYRGFEKKKVLSSFHSVPHDLKVEVNYRSLTPPSPTALFNNVLKYPVREKAKIAYGPDYSVIANRDMNLTNGKVVLRILNREMTLTKDSFPVDLKSGSSELSAFTLQAYQDSIILLVETTAKRIVCVVTKNKNIWNKTAATFEFTKETVVRFSEKLVVAAAPTRNELIFIARDDSKSEWTQERLNIPQPVKYLSLHNNVVVYYDDQNLYLAYFNTSWQTKSIDDSSHGASVKGLASVSKQTVAKFDLSADTKHQLLTALEQNGLQMINNFISLSVLVDRNGVLESNVHLYLLDSKFNLALKQTYRKVREIVLQISRESKSKDGNYVYHMGYVQEDGLYKVRIKNISGKAMDEISNSNKRQDAIDAQMKNGNKDPEFQKNAKEMFFLDWNKYTVQMSQQGVHWGNDTLLRITGTGWELEEVAEKPQTIELGKNFILESEPGTQTLLKLFKQDENKRKYGQALQNINLYAPGQILNRYPAYIAFQPEENTVKVLTFKDEETLGRLHSFGGEQLMAESDWQNLITSRKAMNTLVHAEPLECLVRPTSTLAENKKQHLVSRIAITGGSTSRFTGYERSFRIDQEKSTYSEIVTVIPGNLKSKHGWHKAAREYHVHTGNVTKTEEWFDSSGVKVLGPPEEKEKSTDSDNGKDKPTKITVLLDKSGKWPVSDFSPIKLEDEMAGYYGFESYEQNIIGSTNRTASALKRWNISNGQIVRDGFSFTGENYLSLNGISSQGPVLEGVFEPSNQRLSYLASCWVRCSFPLSVGIPLSQFKAIIQTSTGQKVIGLKSQVMRQSGDWFYIELPIDFNIVRQIYKDLITHQEKNKISTNGLPKPSNARYKIIFKVEPGLGESIDVDHIRFSPFGHDFQATVYDSSSGKATAKIDNNGFVSKTIYNQLQQEIANIDESGEVIRFTSYSKIKNLVTGPSGQKVSSFPNVLTFEPESGFYERFDKFSWNEKWKAENNDAWNIAPGQLMHTQSTKDEIEITDNILDKSSLAVRFVFALQQDRAAVSLKWVGIGTIRLTRQSRHSASIILPNSQSIMQLPISGELIVLLENSSMFVWLNGKLLFDQIVQGASRNPWTAFKIEAEGNLLIEEMFFMNKPQLNIQYFNEFNEKTQQIQLEDEKNVIVTETVYDNLGREAITTKATRITRQPNKSLLQYRTGFVVNKNPTLQGTVFVSGKIEGEANMLNPKDEGVPFTRTEYAANPLNQEEIVGLPGKEYSTTGPYATRLSENSDIAFLDNLFPPNQGFRQKVEYTPNGSLRVSIFDKRNNQVANYVRVPSFNHVLSTYEYDSENRLVKILPPVYHEQADTDRRQIPWQEGEEHLSSQETLLQAKLGSFFHYNENGDLIRKKTPDTGTAEYLYNSWGQMRFMACVNEQNLTDKIVYFDYDSNNQLLASGYLNQTLTLENLKAQVDSSSLAYLKPYQSFDYSDYQVDAFKRGRVKHCVTYNEGEPIAEKLLYNGQDTIVSKLLVSASDREGKDSFGRLKKEYKNGKIAKITYPLDDQPLELVYQYNRLGQLASLGTNDNPSEYAQFTYHATGQLAIESVRPGSSESFTRSYGYNSPGFLEEISDPFLTENIAYSGKGYGQSGYGDGMVMQASFKASWPENADGRWFQVGESELGESNSALCIQALKRVGYIRTSGQPIKSYYRNAEVSLPLVCGGETGRKLAKLLAKKQIPTFYGHQYAYGNHQELAKAKYFSNESEANNKPMQENVFSEVIPGLNSQQSANIWQLLKDADFIITNQQRNDSKTAVAKHGKSIFRDNDLRADLAKLNKNYTLYKEPIKKFILSAISQSKVLTLADFEEVFLHWQGLNQSSSQLIYNWQLGIAKEIGNMLIEKRYLPTKESEFTSPLLPAFTVLLQQYNRFIPNIVHVLLTHLSYELGESPFDVESYNIDANGNHRLFYTGFNRYELFYKNGTNQIDSVRLNWRKDPALPDSSLHKTMKHDEFGNVVKAMHKNIEKIEYHPVSQRTTRIKLVDGRVLRFFYDAQGERAIKRVFSSNGQLSHETFYLRDEKGRVLLDKRINYFESSKQQIVTAYIYGPRGLLGFIRNNVFHSVTTDHSGSVRLVLRNGRVVAAYDYLPYGQLMRSFGDDDAEAQIMYRYTGQEYDEETGLYNYHARLYDPEIGRFYQPDPKAQYFSPYKYAGNSPVSVVDPDGELALLLTGIVLGIVGAYLGGAAANDRWNPIDWDYSDHGTWIGIIGGAIAGGFLPVGFAASIKAIGIFGTIALGSGGAFLMTASANKNWNPLEWTWDRPETWSALFQGFGAGSGIAGGVGMAHEFAGQLGKLEKLASLAKFLRVGGKTMKVGFLVASYGVGGGVSFAAGVMSNKGNFAFWQWDWTSPTTWSALIDGFDTGMGWPQNAIEITRGIAKLAKNPAKFGAMLGKNASKRQAFLAIIKNHKHPLYKATGGVLMAYFMGSSATGSFDVSKWSLSSWSTYEGILNGIFFGKDTSSMLRYARSSKTKNIKLDATVPNGIKGRIKNWARKFTGFLQGVQLFKNKIEYQKVVQDSFKSESSWRSKLEKLKDKPASVIRGIESFFKGGFEKFKNGESRMPDALKYLLLAESSQKVLGSSKELLDWKVETAETSKKQHEILPDQDAEYLSCGGRSRRRKRAVTASPFTLVSITDNRVDMRLNGGDVESMTLVPTYEYIHREHGDLLNPDTASFLREHQRMLDSGHVLLGYHGTNEIAALSILFNGFRESQFKPIFIPDHDGSLLSPFRPDFGPNMEIKFYVDSPWNGVYVAQNIELSLGYASNANQMAQNSKDHARVLAVYANKADIQYIGLTAGDINKQFDYGKPGYDEASPTGSIFSGDDGAGSYEVVLKEGISLKPAVLPLLNQNDFEAFETFLKLKEQARPQGRFVDFEQMQAMRNTLSAGQFSEADVVSILRYFHTDSSSNDIVKAIIDSKAIQDTVAFRRLQDGDLGQARNILNMPELTEAGFRAMRNHVTQESLMDSADVFRALSGGNTGGDLRNILSSDNIGVIISIEVLVRRLGLMRISVIGQQFLTSTLSYILSGTWQKMEREFHTFVAHEVDGGDRLTS